MLSTLANLKANLEKSETSSVQTSFLHQFPTSQLYYFFGFSRWEVQPPKTPKTSIFSEAKRAIFDPLIDDQVQAPTFQGQVPKARTQTWEWKWWNCYWGIQQKTTDTTRNTEQVMRLCEFLYLWQLPTHSSGSWWRLDQVELMGFSDYVALVATVGVSLLSYACLIGLVTPAIYWCAAWAMNIFEDGGRI